MPPVRPGHLAVCIVVAALFMPGCMLHRREQHFYERVRTHEPVALEQQARILAELESLQHRADLSEDDWAKQWAGVYRCGDGLGMNVMIALAPENGVVYTWHGCLGLYDVNSGRIAKVFPDRLHLKLDLDPKASRYGFMHQEVYFVRWGERRYLVPRSRLMRVVESHNQRDSWPHGSADIPLHIEDQDKPVHGRPKLPPRYAALLRDEPLVAEIVAVGEPARQAVSDTVDALRIPLTLGVGAEDGVYRDMELAWGPVRTGGTLRIKHVGERQSSGELFLFPLAGTEVALPREGDRVVSGGHRP